MNELGSNSNLTSNVQTSTVAEYAIHPVRQFLDHGILATLCTDDPGISGIDLQYEYNVAATAAGLTVEDTRKMQKDALEIAFLSQVEKQQLVEKKRAAQ